MTGQEDAAQPAWWSVVARGQTLVHQVFGEGTVTAVEERRVTVLFAEPFLTKTLKRGPSTFAIHVLDSPGATQGGS